MIKSDVAKLLSIITIEYPKFEVTEERLKLWHSMLKDVSYDLAQIAILKYIAENEFEPKISKVLDIILKIKVPQKITAAEAWGEVEKAISQYGSYRVEEALDSLSPETRKVVNMLDFTRICRTLESELGVVRGQFLKMFDQIQKRERENICLPETLQKHISLLTDKYSLKQIEEASQC